jgi:hypothetical protein
MGCIIRIRLERNSIRIGVAGEFHWLKEEDL